jgi:hypothetical protein
LAGVAEGGVEAAAGFGKRQEPEEVSFEDVGGMSESEGVTFGVVGTLGGEMEIVEVGITAGLIRSMETISVLSGEICSLKHRSNLSRTKKGPV